MSDPESLADRVEALERRLAAACRQAGRSRSDVTLLAVGKTRPADAIRQAYAAGVRCFGENYVDEAVAKIDALGDTEAEWHFIGPIQSNKTRTLSRRFDWVQTVDRVKIARRLAEQRPEGTGPLSVLLQINIDAEPQKAGCHPEDLAALADAVAGRPALRLRGLMAIPAVDRERQREPFARMYSLFETLRRAHPGVDTLSMGMSGDLEAAIAEGSTMVRIGTALFGPREA